MPWRLEAWSPEYDLPERVEGEGVEGVAVQTEIEGDWVAHAPPRVAPEGWPVFYLVDGRQRVEAQLVDAAGRKALLATVIAGAVCRDEKGIYPVGEPRKRHILLHKDEVEPLPPGLSHYQPVRVRETDPASLKARVTEEMRRLEAAVVNELEGGYVVVDGQLYPGEEGFRRSDRLMGYAKTQAATYLSPEHQALLHRLEPYQRTPIFWVPGRAFNRLVDVYSWYVRLPLEPRVPFHGAAALLRVESPTREPAEAKALADLSVSLFCTMASTPWRDPRAPQNLVPVFGLEQWLGRHLGPLEVARRRIVQALFT
ncbi:MAG: DNA double-strand break repair nuclease NurA [Meiothermus sp.]|uniref:DNA double-strand break repair nuclease NurA n=1 Tax=Meiothermus sp. TaxID=1955249 RepID=UPI0025D374FC|nr:DNA double-strand break repair nuclease NurA [Meiothermus sp.]MCS7193535.1 DNA double-strand break repair nuclease NurA [Meiothermus sp.]